MLQPAVIHKKPAWLMNAIALLLVLATSGVLMYVFRNGAPPRMQFAALVAVVLLTPVVLKWQSGWMILYAYLPFNYFIRRFYLVFEGRQPEWGHDLMILIPDAIVILSGVGLLLSRFRLPKDKVPPDDNLIKAPLGLFILLCFLEIFNPYMGSVAAGVNGFRTLAMWCFMVFITQVVVQRREQLYSFMTIVIVTGALTGLYGAYQYLYGFPYYDELWAKLTNAKSQIIGDSMRAFSTFSFTSTFSHYMVIAFSAAVAAIGMKRLPMMLRLLGPFFIGCILLGLALTFVRSAFVGLFAAGLAGLLLASKPQGRWVRMAVALVVVGALVSVVPKSAGETSYSNESTSTLVTERVMSLSDPTKVGSMQVRFATWEYTLQASLKLPVGRGIGAGAASKLGGNGAVSSGAYTESQYFSILSELGWPGILLFLWINFAGAILTTRIHDRLRDPDLRMVARMCLMIQVGLLVVGIAGGAVLTVMPGGAFYWTALGIVTVLPRLDRAVDLEREGQPI